MDRNSRTVFNVYPWPEIIWFRDIVVRHGLTLEWPYGYITVRLCRWQGHSTIFSDGLDTAAFSNIRLRPHLSVGWTFDVRDQSCMKTISQQIRDCENLWTSACGGYDAYISDSKAENLVKGFRGIENGEFDIGAISHLHFGKPDEFIFDAVTRFNVDFFIFKCLHRSRNCLKIDRHNLDEKDKSPFVTELIKQNYLFSTIILTINLF